MISSTILRYVFFHHDPLQNASSKLKEGKQKVDSAIPTGSSTAMIQKYVVPHEPYKHFFPQKKKRFLVTEDDDEPQEILWMHTQPLSVTEEPEWLEEKKPVRAVEELLFKIEWFLRNQIAQSCHRKLPSAIASDAILDTKEGQFLVTYTNKKISNLPLIHFLKSLYNFLPVSEESLIGMLVLLDRYFAKNPLDWLNNYNVHVLVLLALIITEKSIGDDYPDDFIRLAAELALETREKWTYLERQFLNDLEYECFITKEDFNAIKTRLNGLEPAALPSLMEHDAKTPLVNFSKKEVIQEKLVRETVFYKK